jgi:hypothetical protein
VAACASARFVTPPPSSGVVSQSGAPWGVVSDKVVCGVWCSGWRPMGCVCVCVFFLVV